MKKPFFLFNGTYIFYYYILSVHHATHYPNRIDRRGTLHLKGLIFFWCIFLSENNYTFPEFSIVVDTVLDSIKRRSGLK